MAASVYFLATVAFFHSIGSMVVSIISLYDERHSCDCEYACYGMVYSVFYWLAHLLAVWTWYTHEALDAVMRSSALQLNLCDVFYCHMAYVAVSIIQMVLSIGNALFPDRACWDDYERDHRLVVAWNRVTAVCTGTCIVFHVAWMVRRIFKK